MKLTNNLQNRLIGAFIITTFTISSLYGFLVFNAMKHTEDDILNRRLLHEAEHFINQYSKDPSTARLPNSIELKSYLSSSPDLPALLRNQALGTRELHEQEVHVGVMEIPDSNELLYLTLSELESSSLESELSMLLLILVTVGGLITSLGLIVGLLFSRAISQPIVLLTEDVKNRFTSIKSPFYGSERDDEVGALSRAFEALVNRLDEFLEREKNFTRFASHELRTPIALIKNALSVLRLPQQDDERRERNLGRIESAAVELESLVNTFLTLGREGAMTLAHINIEEVIKNNIARNQLVHHNKNMVLQLVVEIKAPIIQADEKLVDILIDNIVRNIYAHGASQAHIVIRADAIEFRNNIPEDAKLSEEGQTYGMEIVDKLCLRCGFELTTIYGDRYFTIYLNLGLP